MRSLLLLLPLVIVAAACAEPVDGEETVDGTAELNSSGSSCSLSRAKILSSVSAARSHAIERGFAWLDDSVPYSKSAQHEGYRTDCSGFVSMCWELGTSSNTDALVKGDRNKKLGSYDELVPADALLRNGHVMMFVGWNDANHSGACVLEQSSTKNDMQFRVHTTASLKSGGYKAVRSTKLAGDTATSAGTDDESLTPAPKKKTPTSNPAAAGADRTNSCPPPPAADICNAAWEGDGVECGTISDGCGGTVNCDSVATFGCATGETCSPMHQCSGGSNPTSPTGPGACRPRPAAELCNQAKTAMGVQCGTIPDECGGSVSCDAVPSFGCGPADTCGTTTPNKCDKTAAAPAAKDAPPTTQPTATELGTDPGDEGAAEEPAADKTGGKTPAKKKASGGCNASSQSGSGDALPFVGLALAAAMVRRRSRRQSA